MAKLISSIVGPVISPVIGDDEDDTPVVPTEPAEVINWTLTDAGNGGDLILDLVGLPYDGGDAIEAVEIDIDGGGYSDLGLVGTYTISGTVDVEVTVSLKARNTVGDGVVTTKAETPTLAATVPAAMVDEDWALSNPGTGGALEVEILSLPDNGGSSLLNIERRVGAGFWTAFNSTALGTYMITGLLDDIAANVRVRAVNAVGAAGDSDTKTETPTTAATVPAAFTELQWTLDNPGTGGEIEIIITALPDDGGAALVNLYRQTGSGSLVALGAVTTGIYSVTGLTNSSPYSIKLYAENAVGVSLASDTKTETPTLEAGHTVSTQEFEYGVKNAPQTNGFQVVPNSGTISSISIDSGDAAGDYEIVGDVIQTASGKTAVTKTLTCTATFTDASTSTFLAPVTAVATGYSVSNTSEVSSLGHQAGLAFGDIVLFRKGSYGNISIKRTGALSGTFNGSNQVVFRPSAGESVVVQQIKLNNQWGAYHKFKFQNLDFNYPFISDLTVGMLLMVSGNSTKDWDVVVDGCSFTGDAGTDNSHGAIWNSNGGHNISVLDTSFVNLRYGIRMNACDEFKLKRCYMKQVSEDCLQWGDGANIHIHDNYFEDCAPHNNSLGIHGDFLQGNYAGSTTDVIGLQLLRNVMVHNSTSNGAQGIFINTNPAMQLIAPLIENNIYVGGSSNGIRFSRATDPIVRGNIVVFKLDDNDGGAGTILLSDCTDGLVQYNVANSIPTPTGTGNVVANNTIVADTYPAYAANFVNYTEPLLDAEDDMDPVDGSAAFIVSPKHGTYYVDWVNNTDTNPY